MNTPMNIDELVGALRSCSNPATRKPDCDNCPLFGERLCVKKMLEGGADLIESLQAQLAALREKAEREKGCEHCRGWDSRCGANYCPVCGKRLEVKHDG